MIKGQVTVQEYTDNGWGAFDDEENFFCELICETEKAWLIEAQDIYGHQREMWIPKSQCDLVGISDNPTDHTSIVELRAYIPGWLAAKRKYVATGYGTEWIKTYPKNYTVWFEA